MKKICISIFSIFMVGLLLTINVHAKEIQSKPISDLNKSWTITFNKIIDDLSIIDNSIYIIDSKGKKLDIILEKYSYSNKVTIKPKDKYIPGENYTICVTKNIKDKEGLKLKEETCMNFNVASFSKPDILKNPNYYMDTEYFSDVNGDGKTEKIQVVFKKNKEIINPYCHDEIRILIKNNLTNEVLEDIDCTSMGHISKLNILDFNKDGIKDIMIPLPVGGSGGYMDYIIYSFKDNKLTTLYSENVNNGIMAIDKYIKYEFFRDKEEVAIWSITDNKKLRFNFSNYFRKPEDTNYESLFALPRIEPVNIKPSGGCDLKIISVLCTNYKEFIVRIETIYTWDINKGNWIIDDIKLLPSHESIIQVK